MKFWEFLKHGIGGSGAIAVTELLLEKELKKQGITGVEYDKKLAIGVGAIGGGFLGYYLGELVGNHSRNYSTNEKFVSTSVGSIGGVLAATLVGTYLGEKRKFENEITEEKIKFMRRIKND